MGSRSSIISSEVAVKWHVVVSDVDVFLSAPKESYEAVAYRLLDKVVAAELVSATISTKVKTYAERHSLKLDHVLLNYVKVSHMVGVHFFPLFSFSIVVVFFSSPDIPVASSALRWWCAH